MRFVVCRHPQVRVPWFVVLLSAVFGCSSEAAPLRQPSPLEQRERSSGVQGVAAGRAVQAPAGEATTAQVWTPAKVKGLIGRLPTTMARPDGPVSEAQVELGRYLYYDTRLSKNHDISCNTCHNLGDYGIDRRSPLKTSRGHGDQVGVRNSPTVYNAALHHMQFWDGRAVDVEEQAKGPILNPVEMAMPDEATVLATLRSIPGYRSLFKAAFPEDGEPINYDNVGRAIGAFERNLVTPAPIDAWLGGEASALSAQQVRGLQVFVESGCGSCHSGPAIGGRMYQKLGLIRPYPTGDEGRAAITGSAADKYVFKVPSLRNVAVTAPYLHDGSVDTLQEAVAIMVRHQTSKAALSETEMADLLAFLKSLTGQLPIDYIRPPAKLPSGPKTPAPDPT